MTSLRTPPGPREGRLPYVRSIALLCLGLGVGALLSYLYLPGIATPIAPGIPLLVLGDVETPLCIQGAESKEYFGHRVRIGHQALRALPLVELLARAEPWSDTFRVLLLDSNGLTLAVSSGDELSDLQVGIDDELRWTLIDTRDAPEVAIPELREIALVSTGDSDGRGVAVLDREMNLFEFTPGSVLEQGFSVIPLSAGDCPGGSANDAIRQFDSVRRVRTVALGDWIGTESPGNIAVVGRDGSVRQLVETGSLLLEENYIGYCTGDGHPDIPVRGLVLDAPERRVTDVYSDARDALARGDGVLIVLLDGLGYHQFVRAADAGRAPFLSGLAAPDMALAAYPPITPVNLAAAITGADPSQTGIRDRDTRRSHRPSIFAAAEEMGHRSTLVTGPISPLDLEIVPALNVDRNGDGSTDDEVLRAALDRIDAGYGLLMVHLKDVDRAGHSFGPDAPETLDAIERSDGYIRALVAAWSGPVIVFSDHGMHETSEGGYHGQFRVEDMMIPYWTIDGGIHNE